MKKKESKKKIYAYKEDSLRSGTDGSYVTHEKKVDVVKVPNENARSTATKMPKKNGR